MRGGTEITVKYSSAMTSHVEDARGWKFYGWAPSWPLAISEYGSGWEGRPTCAGQSAAANVLPEGLQTPYLSHVDESPAEFDQKHKDLEV